MWSVLELKEIWKTLKRQREKLELLEGEVDALTADNGTLKGMVNSLKQGEVNTHLVNVLLAEYNELSELWRHTDSRINNGLNIFLASNAVVAAALAALLGQAADPSKKITSDYFGILWAAVSAIAFGLFLSAIVYAHVIITGQVKKEKYIVGLNQIRRYFNEKYGLFDRYLVHKPAMKAYKELTNSNLRVKLPGPLLLTIIGWGSGMFVLALGAVWMAFTNGGAAPAGQLSTVIYCGVAALVALIVSVLLARRFSAKKYEEQLIEHQNAV